MNVFFRKFWNSNFSTIQQRCKFFPNKIGSLNGFSGFCALSPVLECNFAILFIILGFCVILHFFWNLLKHFEIWGKFKNFCSEPSKLKFYVFKEIISEIYLHFTPFSTLSWKLLNYFQNREVWGQDSLFRDLLPK